MDDMNWNEGTDNIGMCRSQAFQEACLKLAPRTSYDCTSKVVIDLDWNVIFCVDRFQPHLHTKIQPSYAKSLAYHSRAPSHAGDE
jgi:hypothetical protein